MLLSTMTQASDLSELNAIKDLNVWWLCLPIT